jgi:hypothetical protein
MGMTKFQKELTDFVTCETEKYCPKHKQERRCQYYFKKENTRPQFMHYCTQVRLRVLISKGHVVSSDLAHGG